MSTYIDYRRVLYTCSCGTEEPICRLYFCRHCMKLRCGHCVSHEVDSHYCPNCLENMPIAEAKAKKNRCVNCFDCPSCRHTLSTRATSIAVPDPQDATKTTPKKVYYLACGFCRWTSRDGGIPDQQIASGGWQDQINKEEAAIAATMEYYKQLASKEKIEKDRKKYRRRSYLHFSDKFGLSSAAARRRAGLMNLASMSLKEGEEMEVAEPERTEATDQWEPLDDSIYTEPLNLATVTSVKQRLASVEFQPANTGDLYPSHKHLLIKRSQRCRQCEHNVSKPDFNPSSTKFKIQLVALHHVPEVRLMSIPNMIFDQPSQVILTLANPVDYITHVTLLPNCKDDAEADTGKIELPICELTLAPLDSTGDFDDTAEIPDYDDDPKIVTFRKANKIGFFVKVTPKKAVGDVKVSFLMKYDSRCMPALLPTDDKESPVWLEHTVHLNLGPLNS
ncbi:unnamed protein product [Owenia fusiformis]|uniref:Dynactin subunit 4 n=1 Tax=Owenia fusiformis TaxID=6347 RepID=A0A8J1Y6J8_OWEFU|nr:unnamed protein product [Owenia fusiformis]